MQFSKMWLWLPLSLPIFCIDIVQRGFAAFAKSKDFAIPHISEAMSIYFFVLAVAVLIFGYVCDKYNARKVLLVAMTAAAIGMASIPYTPWGFGLIFGAAAALIKVAPFSAALKLINSNEAIHVSPQAASKNVAGALFTLFIGAALATIGWVSTTTILAIFIFLSGLLVYYTVPDDKIEGWKFSIFKELIKDWRFWMMGVYFFLMSGWYYIAVFGFVPSLVTAGYGKMTAATIMATSFLLSGALRFFVAWLGNLCNNKVRLPLLWIGTFGMFASTLLTPTMPIFSLCLFTFMSSIHTPNYWAYCKEIWGPTYISTVVSLGFFFMYLGTGIMVGKWV
jgi:MFS family permease